MTVSRKTTADVSTTVGSEVDITTITDAGIFELNSDISTLANGEELIFRGYLKTRNAGTERLRYEWSVKHAQYLDVFTSIPMSNVDHLRISVEQVGGSTRTLPTSVYQLDA